MMIALGDSSPLQRVNDELRREQVKWPDELRDPIVVATDDEFNRLVRSKVADHEIRLIRKGWCDTSRPTFFTDEEPEATAVIDASVSSTMYVTCRACSFSSNKPRTAPGSRCAA